MGNSVKIERARALLDELSGLIESERVFDYVVETDYEKGERWTRARENLEVSARVSAVAGDVIHNLRAALDHAFWTVVSPHVEETRKKSVQFPYARNESGWERELETRGAIRVGGAFCDYVRKLNVYPGGDSDNLVLVHEVDIEDKHKTVIPIGDFKNISSSDLVVCVPDFPGNLVDASLGMSLRDVMWRVPKRDLPRKKPGGKKPVHKISSRILPINVRVCFRKINSEELISIDEFLVPVIDEVESVVKDMLAFA
ncbi:hypothetical protein [Burkholderia gladioli]|uniref:hypothetical protein n=1 Tax=Burkholderia gladioli TaxID=28095 RepID=UPI001641A411|nr:hypothetical protein [Burkholderia gladioli]MDC6130521.1 hypothetical protein [Burkholderia gladioli]